MSYHELSLPPTFRVAVVLPSKLIVTLKQFLLVMSRIWTLKLF